MQETFDPIDGPHERPPTPRPGAVVLLMGDRGVEPVGRSEPLALPPPERQGVPGLASDSTSVPLFRQDNEALQKALSVGSALAAEGGKLAARGARGLLDFARRKLGSDNRRYYLVSISRRQVSDSFETPSADPGIFFRATLTYDAQVRDPAGVLSQAIRDVRAHFGVRLRKLAADTCGTCPSTEIDRARRQLQAALDAGTLDDRLVAISSAVVDMRMAGKAQDLLTKIGEERLQLGAIRAEGKVGKEHHEVMGSLTSTAEDLSREWLRTKDGRYKELYLARLQENSVTRAERKEWIRLGIEKKMIYDHEVAAMFPDLLAEVKRDQLSDRRPAKPGLPGSDPGG